MIEDFASLIPDSLLERSGKGFYSGRTAFENTSKLYVLGLNPGGSRELQATQTIGRHTEKVLGQTPNGWSEYQDESWSGLPAGTRALQRRILHLFSQLQLDPQQVPASNLIFVRSARAKDLQPEFNQLAQACWPFHARVIEELGVSTILCFGRRCGNWVRKQLDAHNPTGEFIEQNARRWRNSAYTSDNGITVIIATHPSIADWTNPATDPSQLVAQSLPLSAPFAFPRG
jgi:hypothetical protein